MNETSYLFQIGSRFPEIAGASICNSGTNINKRLELQELKKKVMVYLNTNEKARISKLAEIFNAPPRLVILALNELEKEGLITETD